MTKEQAIKYCEDHKDEFIKAHGLTQQDGERKYNALMSRIKGDDLEPTEQNLIDHNMDFGFEDPDIDVEDE